MELFRPLHVVVANRGPDMELLVVNPVELSGKGRPLVFYDITLALKMLQVRIFLVCITPFPNMDSYSFSVSFLSIFFSDIGL